MENFQVCVWVCVCEFVCVRNIESSLKVSKSCQQAHPAADLTVYGCGNHPVVYLVSILFLSPCPQAPPLFFFCSLWGYAQVTHLFPSLPHMRLL